MQDTKIVASPVESAKVEEKPRRADRSMKIKSSVKAGVTRGVAMPD
jgi:hypothetical protein